MQIFEKHFSSCSTLLHNKKNLFSLLPTAVAIYSKDIFQTYLHCVKEEFGSGPSWDVKSVGVGDTSMAGIDDVPDGLAF